jgi:hypothetical protein
MKKILFIIMLVLIYSSVPGQNTRITSLGGMTIALDDPDLSLNLYDFGKNPAWLVNDETSTWLKILPSVSNNKGDYRRKYDFEAQQYYDLTFTGVKPLGTKGTFLGSASYAYDNRENVYRSLKYNTYGGEASFMVDTTKGDFIYNGPRVGFIYSLELLPDFLFGVSANYELLDGLKQVYSNAKTIYREVNGNVGLAYIVNNDIVVGLNLDMFDTQEIIEPKNLEALDVEIFSYRGETYYLQQTSSTLQEKVRKKGIKVIPQLYLKPLEDFEIAVQAGYSTHNSKIYIGKSTLKEFEDCYSDFKDIVFGLKAKYKPTPDLTAGLIFNYAEYDNWSKNSSVNLLTWEWNVKKADAGLGITYQFKEPGLLVGAEYVFGSDKADSSKYIDYRFSNLSSVNHFAKAGMELLVSETLTLRVGYNIGFIEHDILVGGKDVMLTNYSIGGGMMFGKFNLNLSVHYSNKETDSNLSRSYLGANAEIMLFSF